MASTPQNPAEMRLREDAAWMELALEQARLAAAAGEVPVGALVIKDGQVLGRGHNRNLLDNDPTAHAEIIALRQAAARVGNHRLPGCTLYSTIEPCSMCAGALVAARVARLVFGAVDPKAGSCGSLYNLCADPRLNHEVEVTPGVLSGQSADLLASFFADRRSR